MNGQRPISALDTKNAGKLDPMTKISGVPTWLATISDPEEISSLPVLRIFMLSRKQEHCAHRRVKKTMLR
jgi:hypothetical protein